MQCFQEQLEPSSEFQSVEIRDDGLYSSTCNKGHTTLTVVQQQKFEILFEFGAMALLDGYPREAITSIAASLERFYEFYITVTCMKHNIELVNLEKTWKHVSAQSERQFGGYLFTYLVDHQGSEPPVIDNDKPNLLDTSRGNTKNWKEFRNAVVHKGYIPSVNDTLAYGNIVYHHLYDLIKDLKDRSGNFVQKATFHHIARAHEAANGKVVSTMILPTIINLEQKPLESLEKALDTLKCRHRHIMHM
ncbi:hypothetical protein [Pseudanabaena sp. lw0831]|uniref:hypothetical protein n=1 Tax=Pseudanabaena sp. lw0831 TaxID=1357935 RepID=UPI0019160536|nr:hypothetical protein [Pseudanabaena sp. lw0831]